MTSGFRVLDDGRRDGATNMAVDESLLDAYASATAPAEPTLRLYGWRPPALSLGRRQPASAAHDPSFLARNGIDLVRRPTGGRAVLHEHELTYAVAGRLATPPFRKGVLDTYATIAGAIAAALRAIGVAADAAPAERAGARDPGPFGPPVCFDRAGPHEIVVEGRKLVGSAQVRRRGAFLQHGSILLRADPARLAGAVGAADDAPRLVDLETALGRAPDERRLRAALRAAFEEALGLPSFDGELTAGEARESARLRAEKYATAAWTLHGRP